MNRLCSSLNHEKSNGGIYSDRMKRVVTIWLSALAGLSLQAQELSSKDSLKQAYSTEKNDSLKVWKHLDYIRVLLDDYQKQQEALQEIEGLKKEIKNSPSREAACWAYYYEGLVLYDHYDYLNSIIAIEKLNRLAAEGDYPESIQHVVANSLITLGVNYSMINDLENAQLSYQKAIRQLQVFEDSSGLVHAYINLGYLFSKSQDWVSAKNIFVTGLAYLNGESRKDFSVPLYASLSVAEAKLGNPQKAGSYLAEAAAWKKKFTSVMADNFYEQANGENELLKKNYPAAINAFDRATVSGRSWGDSSAVAESFEGLGRAYWSSGNREKALECLRYSKQIATGNRLIDQQKIILKTLFACYRSGNLFRDAALVADTLLQLNDTLAAKQNNNRRIILNALFESEQNARKISSLQQQHELTKLRLRQKNTINYILAGTVVSVVLISLLGYRNYRQKQLLHQQRIQELEKEKMLQASDAVLKGQEEERSRIAKDLHDGLGGMLSGIKYSFSTIKETLPLTPDLQQRFERGMDMLDSSISELRRVAHNMMPEALFKYGLDAALKDFCTSINSSGVLKVIYQGYGLDELRVNQTGVVIIYRVIQELMNNIIKHAGAAQAVVQVNKDGNKLLITVEDDGRGIGTAQLTKTDGIGWANIRSRLDYLKARVDVQGEAGKGTFVNIEIDV